MKAGKPKERFDMNDWIFSQWEAAAMDYVRSEGNLQKGDGWTVTYVEAAKP